MDIERCKKCNAVLTEAEMAPCPVLDGWWCDKCLNGWRVVAGSDGDIGVYAPGAPNPGGRIWKGSEEECEEIAAALKAGQPVRKPDQQLAELYLRR
jgi:hypothetical protein